MYTHTTSLATSSLVRSIVTLTLPPLKSLTALFDVISFRFTWQMFSSDLMVSIISLTKPVFPACAATASSAVLSKSTLPLSVLITRLASVFSASSLTVFSGIATSDEATLLLPAASIIIFVDLFSRALSTILSAVLASTVVSALSPLTAGIRSAVVLLSAGLLVTLSLGIDGLIIDMIGITAFSSTALHSVHSLCFAPASEAVAALSTIQSLLCLV